MPSHWKFLKITFNLLSIAFLSLCIFAVIFAYQFYEEIEQELPDIQQLKNVKYQIPLSVYSADNKLIARFGEKKRIPAKIDDIPQIQLNAFLSAEDASFYSHPGVDIKGLSRAAIELIRTGKKKQGGSTITMQVARNFLLSREKTYIRKIKEIILALKIEKKFSKNEILQLYLNKIYLGHRSYGLAAAAQTYYGQPLDQLTLAQMAMLAGLPKAPSSFNPVTNPERALIRRDYVLNRMLDLGHIDQASYDTAIAAPVTASINASESEIAAPHIAEMVRNQLFQQYGEDIYSLGLNVYTTIKTTLQTAADTSLRHALHAYDQRHGYRSLPHSINEAASFTAQKIGDTQLARVMELTDTTVIAELANKQTITLPWENIQWARPFKSRYHLGPAPKTTHSIFSENMIFRVRQKNDGSWSLAQLPEIEGAFVAIDPNDGKILALSGGFDFFHNKYNRVTQSKRQPGSGFKPIIYTTALENGYSVASIINDAPVVVSGSSLESDWRPENYSRKFYGPTRLRTALRKSRNLISIRLLRDLGIEKVRHSAFRFGFSEEQVPKNLSLSLGSGYASPLQMSKLYAVFANGGFLVEPYFIKRIENHQGEIMYEHTAKQACSHCTFSADQFAPRIISSEVAFLMNSMLQDVVRRGTATRAKSLGRNDLAGKTGTTNDQRDAWFSGYTPDIVATAWVGFDDSKPLGRGETGGKAALPMWVEFMQTALENLPEKSPERPENIESAYINPETGLLAQDGQPGMWEYFRKGNIPRNYSPVETAESIENSQQENLDLF